jgi:hypothetical protein
MLATATGYTAQIQPAFPVTNLEVGKVYKTDGSGNTWGKVLQVIDDDNMLIAVSNGGDNYPTVLWCKFPTKNIVDGKKDFLSNIIKTEIVKVTGTKRYNTTDGTKTVYVLEKAQ